MIGRNLKVRYATDRVREGKTRRLDVMYDKLKNAWYAFIPVDIAPAKQAVSIQPEKVGSIDLGICNLAAFYAEGQQPIVYSGRAVLSDFVYKTKKIADLHSKLKQKQYTSKKIGLMFRKRTRRFKHAMRAMLKDLFARMKQIGITKVAVGDLTGIRDNNNLGTHTNQKLHNFWSHRQTVESGYNTCAKTIWWYGVCTGATEHDVQDMLRVRTAEQHNCRVHRGLYVCEKSRTR